MTTDVADMELQRTKRRCRRGTGTSDRPGHVVCSRCDRSLPITPDNFGPEPRNRFGVSTTCLRCHTLRRYDITYLDYLSILESQGGVCAICGKDASSDPRPSRRLPLDVDHCHATGKVRGLLCNLCNRGLGYFGDNADGLRLAIAYLEAV